MRSSSLSTIYRGMGEFMVIQLLCLGIIVVWPEVVLWLPRMFK
jgi:TRAP-type mannitol/chloroaromatic compound transport system permease large subunit